MRIDYKVIDGEGYILLIGNKTRLDPDPHFPFYKSCNHLCACVAPFVSTRSTSYCAGTNSAVMPEIAAWENYSAGGKNERGLKHGWRSVTLSLITASLAAVLSHVDNSSRTADKNTCRGYSWKNSAALYVFIGSLYVLAWRRPKHWGWSW